MKKQDKYMYFGTVLIILIIIGVILVIFTSLGDVETTKYYFTELDVVLECKIYSGSTSYRFICYENGEKIEINTNSFIKLEDYEKIQGIKNE